MLKRAQADQTWYSNGKHKLMDYQNISVNNKAIMTQQHSIYELIGGDETFRRLVDRFYERVEANPLLRPLFPEDMGPGKEYQFLFLTQYFGGPPRYNALRGHPRLRMRHMPFPIDQAMRDAWLFAMLDSIDEIGIEEPARSVMREYFERSATFMMNQEQPNLLSP